MAKELNMKKKDWEASSIPTPEDFNRLENIVPTGSFMWYYSISAPPGWLTCDGTLVDSEKYPELYKLLLRNGVARLPNLIQPDKFMFVGSSGNSNDIRNEQPAFSNIVYRHNHDVNITHGHEKTVHSHDMQHSHLMYGMHQNEGCYEAFPYGYAIKDLSSGYVFDHAGKKDYPRKAAYTSCSMTYDGKSGGGQNISSASQHSPVNKDRTSDTTIDTGNCDKGEVASKDCGTAGYETASERLYPRHITMLPIIKT